MFTIKCLSNVLFSVIFACVFSTTVVQADMQIKAEKAVTIILPTQTIPSEETAANDLQHYLLQITGVNSRIVRENHAKELAGNLIYIGPTQFAQTHLKDKSTFAGEEWLMQTASNVLILTGGRPRGTLYAVYHFLEDVCGVRWWNPWEETVPRAKVLSIPALNKRAQPAFRSRDIFSIYGNDDGRFMARSRLNRQGDADVDAAYGGSRDYGPPYHVHTLFKYLPPEKYYKEHPEWYISPNGGMPTARTGQLCLSNLEMRREFLKVLLENIRTSRQKAIDAHLPPPDVYSVSQEDNRIGFVCDDNKALVEKEGSESAIVLDFVNYLADGIKDEFPDVYIDTLAYFSGEKAPKTIQARDNVIVRLTDTQSDVLLPITAERNKAMRQNVEEWAKHCKNLRIWDYNITYIVPHVPQPSMQTYPTDLRFFLEHNAEGMFIEFEHPLDTDMRDLKLWVLCKLLEDPHQDYDALVKEFTNGFYGAAGSDIRQYLSLLQTAAKNSGADIDWFAGLLKFTYLNVDFLQKADRIYQQAAEKVADDPVLSQRVRNARSSVDIAILRRYQRLMQSWVQSGHTPDSMPLNRDTVAQRFLQNRNEQIEMRLPEGKRAVALKDAATVVAGYNAGPAYIPLPAKFRNVTPEHLFTYSALDTRNYQDAPKVVADEDAESGMATRFELPTPLGRYSLPMEYGLYDTVGKKSIMTGSVKKDDIPGPGYHWYKLGEGTLTGNDYLYFFWSWWIQNDVMDAYDSANPTAKYEIWANLKFAGPAFPFGVAQDPNAISVERMVLVRK